MSVVRFCELKNWLTKWWSTCIILFLLASLRRPNAYAYYWAKCSQNPYFKPLNICTKSCSTHFPKSTFILSKRHSILLKFLVCIFYDKVLGSFLGGILSRLGCKVHTNTFHRAFDWMTWKQVRGMRLETVGKERGCSNPNSFERWPVSTTWSIKKNFETIRGCSLVSSDAQLNPEFENVAHNSKYSCHENCFVFGFRCLNLGLNVH